MYIISIDSVRTLLGKINVNKSTGQDNLPNWILKDFQDVLSAPVCSIFNSSITQACVPTIWTSADIVPMAFYHIDHNLLLQKWSNSDIPEFLINWKHSFLCDRQQHIKIQGKMSSWQSPSGVIPQGTKSGGKDFKRMVKDMDAPLPLYKYVDDTTLFEVCVRGIPSDKRQQSANGIADWCQANIMMINAKKTKELVICFAQTEPDISRLIIKGQEIERVSSTKLLGLTLSDDPSWGTHIEKISKKAS